MTLVTDAIGRWVRAAVASEAAMLEEACEQAVQSGQLGVLYVRGFRPIVTGLVPFGELYEFPSRDAVQAWLDRRSSDSETGEQ